MPVTSIFPNITKAVNRKPANRINGAVDMDALAA